MNNPELYAGNNDMALAIVEFILKKYEKWLSWKENGAIIDIGIGDGNVTKNLVLPRINANFSEYVGLDISEGFLEIAKRTLKGDSRFNFVNLDIETDDLPKELMGRFDNVLSFLALHWVRKPRDCFRNLHEMLKHEGEMFLVYFDKVPIDFAFAEMAKNPRWTKYDRDDLYSPYFRSKDPQRECEEDLKAAGIKNYEIRIEKDLVFYFPTEDNWKNLLYSVHPVLKDVPEEEVEDFKKDYVKYALEKGGYFRCFQEGKETIGSKCDQIIIHAKK